MATAAGARSKPSSTVAEAFYPPEIFHWVEMPMSDTSEVFSFEPQEPWASHDYSVPPVDSTASPGTAGRRTRGLTPAEKSALERKVAAKQESPAALAQKFAAGTITALGSESSEPVRVVA